MKTILALSLIFAGVHAFAEANPTKAFSQNMTDLVDRLPKDPTGADLSCSSASGNTALFAALPGDLTGTAVVMQLKGQLSADVDTKYVQEAAARGFDVAREIKGDLNVGKIVEDGAKNLSLSAKSSKEVRFVLKTVPGTTRSTITDGGATGTIRFDALLSARGLNNIRVSCVQEWAL
jgi:hypothetical protein